MLGALLSSAARSRPDHPALIAGPQRLSYRTFDTRAQAFAHGLLRLGLQRGDRVAFQLPNGIETALCYFACFKAGLIGVPCNTRLTPPEMAFMLAHSQARAFVGRREWYERFAPACGDVATLQHIVLVDREALPAHAWRFDALIEDGTALPDFTAVSADADALILYTSGTSARPKGVLHTHASLCSYSRLWALACGLGRDERLLLTTHMMHVSGATELIVSVRLMGTAAIVPAFDPAAALDALETVGCTHVFSLPVAYHALVNEQKRAPRRVGTLQSAIGGGDSLTPALVDAFQRTFGVPLQEGHGMTECGPNLVNPAADIRPGSMGLPLPGVEARIDAAEGGTGELLLRTPALFAGYWRDDVATRQAMDGGFLRTGDLARVDDEGFFWFAGRCKEIIVHGAANVSPQEVEEALCDHPAVARAGVVGLPDPVWGESVHAVVVLEKGAAATAEQLRAFLADRLADWKAPASIAIESDLPIGPTGKVQRRMLRERVLEGTRA
jgi:long-chain acyl-CoA synthetase